MNRPDFDEDSDAVAVVDVDHLDRDAKGRSCAGMARLVDSDQALRGIPGEQVVAGGRADVRRHQFGARLQGRDRQGRRARCVLCRESAIRQEGSKRNGCADPRVLAKADAFKAADRVKREAR